MTLDGCRAWYAEEIRFSANVQSAALVEAFARVPRERFVGPGPWQIGSPEQRALSSAGLIKLAYIPVDDPRQLYHNVLVVLDQARDINNGQPSALARWIDLLDLKPGDRVYHLGCGVGYYTAILAEVVGSGGSVVAVELEPDLAPSARQNLSDYPHVTVQTGDGAAFDPGDCNAMLINAGVTRLSPLWLERLRPEGRLVVPFTIAVSSTIGQGVMARIVRQGDRFSAHVATMLAICNCLSLRDPESETLLKKSLMGGGLLKLHSLRRDVHTLEDTCLVHGPEWCLSAAAHC